MGLLPKRSTPLPSSVASSSTASPVRQVRERVKPYAAIRRAPRPAKLHIGPKQHISKERNSDLRSAYGEGVELRRWFRNGELLWCALNPPISGLDNEKESISFWPGIVEEVKMKSEPVMKPKPHEPKPSKEHGPDSVMTDGTKPYDAPNANTPRQTEDEDNGVPWDVVQTLWYKIKLLGISFSYNIRSDQVIPYQAHSPSDDLIQAIHRVPLKYLSADTNSFQLTSTTRFVDAAAPFAFAVQIAANMTGFWSPTDDWEYRFTIPPLLSAHPRPPIIAAKPVISSGSLDSVMNASMAYNASLTSAIPAVPYANSTSSLQAPSQSISQTRYQGLWWGAERIWTDELVRLKLSRAQVAPMGAENILPPAGPSRKVIEYVRELDNGSPEEIVGAAARGVFMLVEGLYIVEVQKDGSTAKECRVSGMLYELVDEDWIADEGSEAERGDKGKKATEQSTREEMPAASTGSAAFDHVAIEAPLGSQLANPDPAVSVENTTSDVVSHTDSLTTRPPAKVHSVNEQLSRPIQSAPFPLPPPPVGFRFRPIITPGYEAIFSLNFIAGRYYPRILQHPLLDSSVGEALNVDNGGLVEASQLWALEGLTPGFYNTMDPVRWRPSRATMLREAEKEARHGLQQHWLARAKEEEDSGVTVAEGVPFTDANQSVSDTTAQERDSKAMVVDS